MTVLASTADLAKFVHVAGAMVLVGSLLVVVFALGMALRGQDAAAARLGFRAVFLGALPGYIVMRVGAQWVFSELYPDTYEPSWIGIGYITADLGGLLIIICSIVAGLAVRRIRRDGNLSSTVRVRIVVGLMAFVLVAYTVAIWAMTTKPA